MKNEKLALTFHDFSAPHPSFFANFDYLCTRILKVKRVLCRKKEQQPNWANNPSENY